MNTIRATRQRTKKNTLEIDFKGLVRQCILALSRQDGAHRLTVNTTIEGLFPFHGDPILIEVIFSNIISNSIKFRHPHETKPTLDIHVVLHADKVELSFKDNGIGIDRFHLNKVFDMFFCAPENKNAGSGLGLFAVKEAVKKLKGSIRVESIKGTGTTIFAELPNQMDNDLKRKISKIIENSK